jgi:hypothetical protein
MRRREPETFPQSSSPITCDLANTTFDHGRLGFPTHAQHLLDRYQDCPSRVIVRMGSCYSYTWQHGNLMLVFERPSEDKLQPFQNSAAWYAHARRTRNTP